MKPAAQFATPFTLKPAIQSITSLVLAAAAGLACAQSGGIGAIKVEPSPAQVGKEVRITVTADGEAPSFCGMVVHFDDGSESRNVKIDSNDSKFPVTLTHTYAKPGNYQIKAEGKKITSHFPCTGKAVATLPVEGAAAPAQAAAPSCPEGWQLTGKVGKAGDYTCKAGKGAVKAAAPQNCPEGTAAFTNGKARQLGCRATKKK